MTAATSAPVRHRTPATNGPKSMIACPWPMLQYVRNPYRADVPVLGR